MSETPKDYHQPINGPTKLVEHARTPFQLLTALGSILAAIGVLAFLININDDPVLAIIGLIGGVVAALPAIAGAAIISALGARETAQQRAQPSSGSHGTYVPAAE